LFNGIALRLDREAGPLLLEATDAKVDNDVPHARDIAVYNPIPAYVCPNSDINLTTPRGPSSTETFFTRTK
jgi:hypothetical protein